MPIEKTEVRIVAGALRGRKIQCLVHDGMRPTPQMVREALFSILGNAVPGRLFFDVYAGTGVVGLEAISRGALRTTFIERDPKQANAIKDYAEKFGVGDRALVIRTEANRWAERWIPPVEGAVTIFLSPPFPDLKPDRVDNFLKLTDDLLEKMPESSVLVLQVEEGFPMERLEPLTAWDVRDYGRNILLFRVKRPEQLPESQVE